LEWFALKDKRLTQPCSDRACGPPPPRAAPLQARTGAFGLEPSVASRVIEGLGSLLLVTSYNPKETATPDMACDWCHRLRL